MQKCGQTAGGAAREQHVLGHAQAVVALKRSERGVDDALPTEEDLLAIDEDRILAVAAEAVAVAVKHVYTVVLAELRVLRAVR